jgi:L-methionine (R)-S-oxide reductase
VEKMDKEKFYGRIFVQLNGLLKKTGDIDSQTATISAVLHYKLGRTLWTGFYFLKDGELLVKTYQGPLACQVLKKNTGVCWTAINEGKTIIVPDVHKFKGHIACDPRSKSEIVVPVRNNKGVIIGVLDIDSKVTDRFDAVDANWLEKIVNLLFR